MIKAVDTIGASEVQVQIPLLDSSLIQSWLKFSAVSEKSAATYIISLKQLARYFDENNITAPTRNDLENWRDELIDDGKAASTICLYLSAAKLFFRWLAMEGIYKNIADNLKNRVRVDHTNHKKDALSATQAKDLQRAVKGTDVKALRDKAIIALLLSTGIRSIEVVRADVADIRYISGRPYLFVQGKGRSEKSESVLLAPKVKSAIDAYLKARGKVAKNAPLFVSTSRRNLNARLQTQSVSRMIKANLRRIGLDSPTITCHSLRHTAATTMIEHGVELFNVQMVLRHKSLNTTMIYNNSLSRKKNTAELTAAEILII